MSDHEREKAPNVISFIFSACEKNLETGVVLNAQITGCGLGAKKRRGFCRLANLVALRDPYLSLSSI